MAQAAHLLIVDDDARIRERLRDYLAQQGYRISLAESAVMAEELMRTIQFDLVVLDVMFEDDSGLRLVEATQQLVPILLLTALSDPQDRIKGLAAGADDYLGKPFDPRELVLRIQAILRRSREADDVRKVRFGEFVLDRVRSVLLRGDEPVHLTTAEELLLCALAATPNHPIGRDELCTAAGLGNPRAVDAQVTQIRRKIEKDPKRPVYCATIRGRGYCLRPDQILE